MWRGQISSSEEQFPCGSWSGPGLSDGRIGKVMLFAGTPGPGTRARLIARTWTVIGRTSPVGPGFTQNQYFESHTQPRCPLKGGGFRRFETIGAVAALMSKLTVPLTVQPGSASSFGRLAVTVSVPGLAAIPYASPGEGSSPAG